VAIVVFLLAAALSGFAQAADPAAPGSAALVEDAGDWDGRTVVFAGEAVGEAMRRGNRAWIHLNDDAYGIGGTPGQGLSGYNSGIAVWVDAERASPISLFGDYKHHGDLVKVHGVFHAACPEHGGDLDIHADSLQIVRRGQEVARPVGRSRLLVAAVMLLLTASLFVARSILRRRRPPLA
jgi:hypothetical protein